MDQAQNNEIVAVATGERHTTAANVILEFLTNNFSTIPDTLSILLLCTSTALEGGGDASAREFNIDSFCSALHTLNAPNTSTATTLH